MTTLRTAFIVFSGLMAAVASAHWPSLVVPGRFVTLTQIRVDHEGNVILAGTRGEQVNRSVPSPHFFVTKLGASGAVLWDRTFTSGSTRSDTLKDIAIDSGNGIAVVGQVESSAGQFDWMVIKYDEDGNRVWSRRDAVVGTDVPYAVIVDGDDNVYVGGSVTTASGQAARISKYRPDGARGWSLEFPEVQEITRLRLDAQGAVYGCGSTFYAEATGIDMAVVKVSRFGSHLWTGKYSGPSTGHAAPQELWVDGKNRAVVGVWFENARGDRGYAVARFDTKGGKSLEIEFNGGKNINNRLDAMTVGDDNAIYIGYTTGKIFTTRKYSPEGTLKWSDNFTAGIGISGKSMEVASDGSLFVVGQQYVADFYSKAFVMQFSPTGVRRSMDTYYTAPDRAAFCSGLAFDDSHVTAYVAGYTWNPYEPLLDNTIFTLRY